MEYQANLGSAADVDRPSLFELLAQEQLVQLLQPALKYVLSVLATRYPRYLIRIVNRHEEFYAGLMFFIERHYLQNYGASFAENFYGMKRRRVPRGVPLVRAQAALGPKAPGADLEKLSPAQLRGSLFLLVGLPYLRAKAQELYEIWGGGLEDDLFVAAPAPQPSSDGSTPPPPPPPPLSERAKTIFKRVYPSLNALLEFWLLAYNLRYLFGRTSFYRPWLRWLNVDLRRLSAADYQAMNAPSPSAPPPPRELPALITHHLSHLPSYLLSSLKTALPLTLFALKFLEWWYSPASPRASSAAAQAAAEPTVPPPKPLLPHPESKIPPEHLRFGIDPISGRPLENPTALPSGYVYSYKTVWEVVDKEGRCPVTFQPVSRSQLRKVMP